MKLIRKIYRKLSLFDLGLIVIVFVFGVSFYLFFYRKPMEVIIRVKVTDQDVLYQQTEPKNWYANRFNVGDSELDALGRKITEIIGVESFNVTPENKAVYLDLRVRATYDTRTKLYYTKGKPLIFGTPMRFNLSLVTFDGFVTEFPGSGDQQNLKIGTAKLTVLGRGLEPSVAASVVKGDEIFDSNKNLLAEIKDVQIKSAERVTQTASGDLLLRFDPLYKDLLLDVTVRTKTINSETFIMDNLPLKIGGVLPLNFANVSLFPIITYFKME